jgi:hypothetical protein
MKALVYLGPRNKKLADAPSQHWSMRRMQSSSSTKPRSAARRVTIRSTGARLGLLVLSPKRPPGAPDVWVSRSPFEDLLMKCKEGPFGLGDQEPIPSPLRAAAVKSHSGERRGDVGPSP